MTCQELSEMYELYALGVLENEERAQLDEHLGRGCQSCTAGVRRALGWSTLFATLPELVDPPARLRKKVLANAGVESSSSWAWISGWAATAALLIAILYLGSQERNRSSELAQARQEIQRSSAELGKMRLALDFLNQPETEQVVFGKGEPQPPRGRVFLHSVRGVLLLASNLPAAPAGKMYEMWLIPKGGAPKPAGLFQSDPQGNALYVKDGPLDMASTGAIAVTLEPEAGSSAPTTKPIIVAPLAGA